MEIPFHITTRSAKLIDLVQTLKQSAQTNFLEKLKINFESVYGKKEVFFTKSGTQALELIAIALDIKSGDEVILPSYAFVGCATALSMRGAKLIFVDIDPINMNLSPEGLSGAITKYTKAILTINYAGIPCDYHAIKNIINGRNIKIIEDNAHGLGSYLGANMLGSFGDYSILSFDYLKPISCYEGGALILNKEVEGIEDNYFLGTNRVAFNKGLVNHYEWVAQGSNFILANSLASQLLLEIELKEKIINKFKEIWNIYYINLHRLEMEGKLELPKIPNNLHHNGYFFYLKTKTHVEQKLLIEYLRTKGIIAAFHYTPLHISAYGKKNGIFRGNDTNTLTESGKIVRLPHFYSLSLKKQFMIINEILLFYKN